MIHIHPLGHIVKQVPLSNKQPALLPHLFKLPLFHIILSFSYGRISKGKALFPLLILFL